MNRLRRRRSGLIASVAAVAVALSIATTAPAAAYWSVATSVPSSGASSAASVNQGATPVATVATQNDITVAWAASTLSNGDAVSGYTVTRFSSTDVASAATGACAGTLTTLSCTEANVPDGLWTYAITPRFAVNWLGVESTKSVAVRSDATPPVNGITRTAVSGGSYKAAAANTVYFRGVQAGSFRLSNALTDAGSGPASSSTGTLGGSTAGWSHTPSSVSGAPPYLSNLFSWTAGTTSQPTVSVTGTDVSGNTASSTQSFVLDNTAPTGGAIGYADGYTTATTAPLTFAATADAGAGVDIGATELQGYRATLTGNTCGTYALYGTGTVTAPGTTTVNTPPGFCYQFRHAFTDRVGNSTTATNPNIIRARSYSSVILATPGVVDYFRLDDAGTTMTDIAGTANNGTYVNGPVRGVTGAIAGDANTAVTYDGVNDYSQITRSIGNSFSVEFWFKSTQGIGTGTQWWNGAGLVDAEVSGAAADFGVSLSANGRIMAGVGNPDTTASSAAGYNNGAWHHVVMTRSQTSGQVILYVDGAQVSTVTGGTQALTASANIRFGSLQTNTQFFAGTLDEVALYNAVLTPAQVSNHYLSGLP